MVITILGYKRTTEDIPIRFMRCRPTGMVQNYFYDLQNNKVALGSVVG
jgi:hypothetical protein